MLKFVYTEWMGYWSETQSSTLDEKSYFEENVEVKQWDFFPAA
jgi:hypothetical protein